MADRCALALFTMALGLSSAEAGAQRTGPSAGAPPAVAESLPPDFRGRIVYEGSFSAEAFRAGRAPPNASAIVRRIARRNDKSWTEDGTIIVTVEYDGARISGSHSGSGGMGRGSFTGTRSGRACTISSGQGDSNVVDCTRGTWSGTSRSAPGARVESVVRIDARATRLVDFAQQEREQALARAQAEKQRLADAELARRAPVRTPAPARSASGSRAPATASQGRTSVRNFVNMPDCVKILEAITSTESVRRENAAHFWYEKVTTLVAPASVYNSCPTARLLEITTPSGTTRHRVGNGQGTQYNGDWTYRDLGAAD